MSYSKLTIYNFVFISVPTKFVEVLKQFSEDKHKNQQQIIRLCNVTGRNKTGFAKSYIYIYQKSSQSAGKSAQ